MNSPTIVCILILFIQSNPIRSASLDFGNFLHHDPNRFPPSLLPRSNLNNYPQPPPSTYEQMSSGDDQYSSSESYSEYKSDSDPYLYNSSSEQEFASSNSSTNDTDEHLNSTSTSTEYSNSNISSESNSNISSELHSNSTSSESSGIISSSSESSGVVSSSSESSGVASAKESSASVGSTTSFVTSAVFSNATDGKDVVLVTTAETTTEEVQRTILQKSLDWVKDEYILSILVPVAAGVLFAVTVICTIAMCRCCRRCCRRRRFRKKCLPDSVRNLSTSDRKRLLGDMSSDDEF